MPTTITTNRSRVRPGLSRGGDGDFANYYLTQCKICRLGVYKTQDRVWLTKPIGWSHADCTKQTE